METVTTIVLLLVALKAMLIGSDFSFVLWYKYGEEYSNWFYNRDTFNDFLINKDNKQ